MHVCKFWFKSCFLLSTEIFLSFTASQSPLSQSINSLTVTLVAQVTFQYYSLHATLIQSISSFSGLPLKLHKVLCGKTECNGKEHAKHFQSLLPRSMHI